MTLSLKALLFIFALICISKVYAHEGCTFGQQDHEMQYLDVEEDMRSLEQDPETRRLATYPNMRIYIVPDEIKKSASSSYAAYILNELAPAVASYYEAALRVKYPVVGKLKLGNVGSICGYSVPSILKSGVDADFVTILNTKNENSNNVASSGVCYAASGTKRPLIGHTTFNIQQLKNANGDVLLHEKNMYLLLHEMSHTFGFGGSLYPNFLDENGKRRTGHVKSISIAGKTRTVVDVPPLTQRLREFYGCSSMPGGIMENDGGSGNAVSHFERKYFPYETMSSGVSNGQRVTEFTLALLEGSGWYDPDYNYAEPFFYGKGQGCGFINDKCSSTPLFDEFCSGSTRTCANQGTAGGKCHSDSNGDGCKYILTDNDYACDNDNGVDYARLPSLEVYGRAAGSRCFTGDLNTRKSSGGATSFCFKYNCVGDGSNTQLQIVLGKDTVTCSGKGKVSVSGYYGGINCPDPLEFCGTVGKKFCPRGCVGRGDCVNGVCVCREGFGGVDCALNV